MRRWVPGVVGACLLAGIFGPAAPGATSVAVAQISLDDEPADSADVIRRRAELREAVNRFGEGGPRLLAPLARLGYALLEDSRYAEAERVFRRQLSIAQAQFPAEHIEVAHPLHHIGETYRRMGRCRDGEPFLQQALELRRKLAGAEHEWVGRTLESLARCYSSLVRYAEAEEAFKRALSIFERAKGADSADVATTAYGIGDFYFGVGRFADAEPLLKRALAIREQRFGPDDFRVAPVLTSLSRVFRWTERYRDAENAAKRALAIREARYGPNHEITAYSLTELGVLYMIVGRYGESEQLKRRALSIFERTFGPEHQQTGDALASLAETFYYQGRYNEAAELFQRAVGVLDKALHANHPMLVFPLRMLGQSQRRVGRLNDALPHLTRALAVAEAAYGPDNRRVAQSAATLSRALYDAGRVAEAEALLRRSISINETLLGSDSAAVAYDSLDLAYMMNRRSQYGEAEVLARRSVDSLARLRGAEDYGTGRARIYLAAALEGQNRLGPALDELRQASASFQAQMGRAQEDRSGAGLAEQTSYRGAFIDHAFLIWRMQAADAERREALIAEVFEILQLAQATGTEAAVARMAARFASGTDKLAELVRAREDGIERWRAKDAALVQLFGRPRAERNAQQETQLRAELRDLDAKLKALDARIAAEFPDYALLATPRPAPLLETQALLRPDEAMVAYLVGGRRTLILGIRRDRTVFFRVDIGRAQLNEAVRELRRTLDPSDVTTLQDIRPFDTARAHRLYQTIFAPLEPLLTGARNVFVVPDAGLQSLPLGVLVTEAPSAPVRDFAGYGAVPWLAKRYGMTVLPSLSALKSLRQFARVSRAGEPFVGIGDPTLDGPPGSARGINVAKLFARGAVADASEIRKLPPLPETADELRAMARTLGAADRHLYLGPRATEREVRALDLRRYRVLAFATHGLMAGEFSDVGEPALVMTPPAQSTAEDDGVLTASEIANLKLDADWVILSACNTAAADGTPGAEGLSGLARAFFYAGSRALLVSHWAVLSDATVKLTTRMLSEATADPKLGRAEAHRRAMLALAADKENPHYAHPMFWAPFAVVGEGGAVQ